MNVYDVFDKHSGGSKELISIDEIKEEIMNSGPVVSVSFRLWKDYWMQLHHGDSDGSTNLDDDDDVEDDKGSHSKPPQDHSKLLSGRKRWKQAFAKDCMDQIHELLIVGWCLTPYGEAWQVLPLLQDGEGSLGSHHPDATSTPKAAYVNHELLQIGFGQFGIDDTVLAPVKSMERISWQPGPYFESDFADIADWREWTEMDLPIAEGELKVLAKCFGSGGLWGGESFVLRDCVKKAHSGSYVIKNVKWVEGTEEWFVALQRVDGVGRGVEAAGERKSKSKSL